MVGLGVHHVKSRHQYSGIQASELAGSKYFAEGPIDTVLRILGTQELLSVPLTRKNTRPFVPVEVDKLLRRDLRRQGARQNPTGGSSGDQVENLSAWFARALLESEQEGGGDGPPNSPSANRQN